MSEEKYPLSEHRWNYVESKSLALLWLRTKNQLLTDIANRVKPDDHDDDEAMNLFLDVLSVYGAMDSAIDMVEEVQRVVWDTQAQNAELKLTVRNLSNRVAKYEQQLDELDEYLR
tara:strand:+ start:3793 stop:4137 length:345 start_codon:yes stop_codon:yes gene_type:complete